MLYLCSHESQLLICCGDLDRALRCSRIGGVLDGLGQGRAAARAEVCSEYRVAGHNRIRTGGKRVRCVGGLAGCVEWDFHGELFIDVVVDQEFNTSGRNAVGGAVRRGRSRRKGRGKGHRLAHGLRIGAGRQRGDGGGRDIAQIELGDEGVDKS